MNEIGPAPTLRGTAREVSQYMFRNPPQDPEEQARHYGRSYDSVEIERLRRSQATGVTRVDSRDADGELPSYRECYMIERAQDLQTDR